VTSQAAFAAFFRWCQLWGGLGAPHHAYDDHGLRVPRIAAVPARAGTEGACAVTCIAADPVQRAAPAVAGRSQVMREQLNSRPAVTLSSIAAYRERLVRRFMVEADFGGGVPPLVNTRRETAKRSSDRH
jgi:hypothetical protein